MLGNLKIYCQFKDKGCDQVIQLEYHDNHITSCPFNKHTCAKCQCESSVDGHNCVESLLKLNKVLKDDVDSALIANHLTDYQMIVESRQYCAAPVVSHRHTSEPMRNQIVSIVKNALNFEQNFFDLCKS
ncbi:unnamed protein product, partial [Oppiella nova]